MAKNFVQPGKVLEVPSAATSSGDHVVVGALHGVALTDTDDNGNVRLDTDEVYGLEVVANDGSTGAPIAFGDKVYDDGGVLNVNSSGTLFGIALGDVASGETATIPVKIVHA